MTLYKIQLRLKSPLVTALKGDTIWGHFVWGIANHEGDDAVANFLEECKGTNPPLIVSSAFFKGTVCRPMPLPKPHEKMTADKYADIKKSKKRKSINAEDVFVGKETKEIPNFKFEENASMHNQINRITNTVIDAEDGEGGGLYTVKELWAKGGNEFDLYILSSYDTCRVAQLTQWAFENGYGADSSTGKGNIEVISEPQTVKPVKESNLYMALAPFVVSDFSKVKNLRADTFIRSGKVGGAFSGYMTPWKKTVILFEEGAVFESDDKPEYIGQLLTDVHQDSRICQSGFTPVVPISEDLL